MLASPWALILPFFLFGAVPLIFAHLAFCAFRILALVYALNFFLGVLIAASSEPPNIEFSSLCSDWIFSWMFAAFLNAFGVALIIVERVRRDFGKGSSAGMWE
jgi:hypothetical protein